ncbi:glycosyltransferase [Seohaeicola saemankumensis]|uniref:glycosyltransferase n=1 Tax=Seohaeicola saemankumensis TaxID=481181 RepID=UPI001E40C13D|nr:glycosyltransferase [Seohaeicola saemankumensis]MCD1627365.1 glycosyltransferase [Seohaeicola saemankumensis]
MIPSASKVAAVAIGRNEGERLKRCLTSLTAQVARVVYVDSGSADDSVAFAHSLGVEVVTLDMERPFTAARARNAGFAALMQSGPAPEFVQFVDGDCAVVDGWITAALAHLEARPDLGLVTGWRSEIDPARSVYNAMCDVEWHRPAGPITACGGDMMVRLVAFEALDGLTPDLIAGEDEEFCLRLGKAGWGLERLPLAMTRHDAAMTRFSEWWQRAVRAGHAYAQIGGLHPEHFVAPRRRILFYAVVLPLIASAGVVMLLAGPVLWGLFVVILALSVYELSWLRTMRGLMREGLTAGHAAHQALFLTLSKFPNLVGAVRFFWRRFRRREMRLIEYK